MEEQIVDDALSLIHRRNQFYQKRFYWVLGLYWFSYLIIGLLLAVIVYLLQHPTKPVYFVADDVGRLIQEVPVTEPNMSNAAVMQWAIEAVEAANSYDFVNYRRQLQSAQKYFVDAGWRNFMLGLKASNNLLALTQRKYVVIAKVVGTPRLIREGMVLGARAWKFEMPVLITYLMPPYDEKSRFSNALDVSVIVQRQKELQSYKGLGILQMIARFVSSPTN